MKTVVEEYKEEIESYANYFRDNYKLDDMTESYVEKMAAMTVMYKNLFEEYDLDIIWGNFKYIECLSAESELIVPDTVIITSGTTTVTITWPAEEGADTYTIVITKEGEVVCTLTFNAEGQLLNIAFAPGRNGNHPAQYAEQAGNGYRFTVTGLTEATQYTYSITTKDAENQPITTHSGEFTTLGTPTSVSDIQLPMTNCQKIIRDNQVLILRDGKIYNAMGQEL
mgnify:CR=1 FL=1